VSDLVEHLGILADRYEAAATRRLELLTDCVELLYIIRDHYAVNEITTGEMIEQIEKELENA
jgi:hypothetical protein